MNTACLHQPAGSVVTLHGVTKRFASGVQALAGIELSVARGEFLSVLGPSGCGKSTLLRIIAGLSEPTTGTCELVLGDKPGTAATGRIGFVFQDPTLMPWSTVAGNVEFGPVARGVDKEAARERVRTLIEMVGLRGFEQRYPHELSGGMRQRCALARMLANDPAMWLMDEPLAAVDLQTRIILQEELLRLWGDDGASDAERPTVVFVTHGIDEAVLLADRVLVLGRRPGRIKQVVDVRLPRPRAALRNTPEVARLTAQVWDLIHDEAAQAITEESR